MAHVFVGDIVDGRLNPANSPVEVGSWNPIIFGFYMYPRWFRISSINSICFMFWIVLKHFELFWHMFVRLCQMPFHFKSTTRMALATVFMAETLPTWRSCRCSRHRQSLRLLTRYPPGLVHTLHPWQINGPGLKMNVSKMIFLLKQVIFRFQPLIFQGVRKKHMNKNIPHIFYQDHAAEAVVWKTGKADVVSSDSWDTGGSGRRMKQNPMIFLSCTCR